MMDIVRKNPPARESQNAAWKIREEVRRDAAANEAAAPRVAEPVLQEKPQEVPIKKMEEVHEEHNEPRILESHEEQERGIEMPEISSLDMDRPIAYIPKEKPSREEKKLIKRMERREREQRREMSHGKKRGIVTWIIGCLLLGLGAYLVIAVLPRAEIVLVPKTVEWAYTNTIGASTKIADIDPANRQIPVAVFSEKKSNAFSFPATGSEKSIERKATGVVTIYNEYSVNSQPLVAGTRVETPDGKIFHLDARVVVPGATKSTGGELIPSSIDANVTADKAGETYNISPVSKFTIPGFEGTPKYDAFYAESKAPMTGGFIGEGKYPTTDDIKAAKANAEDQMKGVVESFLVTQVVPEGFKVIESSRKFAITKETVNEAVDDQGNFSVYIEAEGGVDALKEEHVLKLMTALAQQVNGDQYQIRNDTLTYGDIAVDAKTGAISLPIDFKGTFWKPISVDDFKRSIFGKDENELKSFIFSSTNIEKADVSLWPLWVKRVPSDPDRVKVELK